MKEFNKRLFDVIVSALALVFLSPVFVVISVLIKIDSRGPIFYLGTRVGRDGRLFKIYKFRSMYAHADQVSCSPSCADDDPRITKLGGVLRRYKLNELPQLANVFLGQMSLVGPRPEVPDEVEQYSKKERRLLSVKPGITDLASLQYHNEGELLKGSCDPHEAYRQKIRPGKIKLGLEYIEKQSFWLDIKILFMTLFIFFKRDS